MSNDGIVWPDWVVLMKACYGLTFWRAEGEQEFHAWEETLFGELSGLSHEELRDTVKFAHKEGYKPQGRRATVDDLSKWVRAFRGHLRAENGQSEKSRQIDEHVRVWRQKLKNGADRDDAIVATEKLGLRVLEYNRVMARIMEEG